MRTQLAISLAVLLIPVLSLCQTSDSRAERYYNNYLFQRAITELNFSLKSSPNDKSKLLMLADCYVRLHLPEKAVESYFKSIDYQNIDPNHYFRYAEALSSTNNPEEAKKWYKKYATAVGVSDLTKQKLDGLKNQKEFFKDSSHYEVSNFEYNSEDVDFAPALFQEGLLFCSDRIHDNSHTHDAKIEQRRFLNLFYLKNGEHTAHNFTAKINSKFHETGMSFNANEDKLFFTRSTTVHRKPEDFEKGNVNIQLHTAHLENSNWIEDNPFSFNSNEYSVFDPSISSDSKQIFFASDMPGGLGGSDIYVCFWEDGKWSNPINLGPKINSEGNERTPFITNSGTLFFASDGHAGIGGLDIYVTHQLNYKNMEEYQRDHPDNTVHFETVKNLGYPVNSPLDDFSLIISKDEKWGYFASDRKGGKGNDDIYHVIFK